MDKPVTQRAMVLVSAIGTFRMTSEEGADLTPRSRKARALVAVLLIERRPVSRERLADLLWSDREDEQARSSLRQALFEVRHASDSCSDIVVEGRDGLTLNPLLTRSDLKQLESAATSNDWGLLLNLLKGSGPELLEGLDGIDPQFDDWLRNTRSGEPGHIFSLALESAQRCLADGNARQAADIAAEIIRLDPLSEAASRLAMSAAHQQGDRATVNRLFRQLEARLSADFGATPSDETRDLLQLLNKPDPALAAAANGEAGESVGLPAPIGSPSTPPASARKAAKWMVAGGIASAMTLLATTWWIEPSPEQKPPLIAVIPFEEVPRSDGALAEGLWDDTRTTLSRAGAVHVLGRTTSEALARQGLTPADYRKNLDVDYLLDGSVRHEADKVRVTVSLLRTTDGVAIWEHAFNGRLGDSMALQGAIASAIEGRIRGRLAEGGGARATQIPTTPQVYALYSQARLLIRSRISAKARQAATLLDRAIQLDPNFAPAIALSASALYFSSFSMKSDPDWRAKAKARADHAIELAPRLAQAYAVSALIEGINSPTSEQKLIKATTLDPGDAEAWLWLGNARANLGKREAGADAYRRAVDIDPYLAPAITNLADMQLSREDRRGFAALADKLQRADPSGSLVAALRAQQAYQSGDISGGLRRLLPLLGKPGVPDYVKLTAADGLVALGYWDESGRMLGLPDDQVNMLAGRAMPDLGRINASYFLDLPSMTVSTRAIILRGQGHVLVNAYHRYFKDSDEYLRQIERYGDPEIHLPYLAVLLRQAGYAGEAAKMLELANVKLRPVMQQGEFDPAGLIWLAKVRAAQGRKDETIQLLGRVVRSGWLPDGFFVPSDLARDPALRLADGPRFRQLRYAVLASIQRERRELGPVRL